MQKTKILFVPSDRMGVGHYRNIWAYKHIRKNNSEEFDIKLDLSPNVHDIDALSKFDIIHFHRSLGSFEDMETVCRELRKRGTLLVMDIDDYWSPPPTHPLYEIIIKDKVGEKIENNLRLVDWVTTTTEIFAKEIRKFNPNVVVIPNCLDMKEKMWNSEPEPNTSGKVRVAWAGGSCYDDKTEILTEEGFKFFKDLEPGDKVGCYNEKENILEYKIPDAYISEPFDGELICMENNYINFAVTPNHNMYVAVTKPDDALNFKLVPAEKIFDSEEYNRFVLSASGIKKDVIKHILVKRENLFKRAYSGKVYCVNVPGHVVFVRREGKDMLCGNSHLYDLAVMADSLEKLNVDPGLKDKFQIVMCGFDVRGNVTEMTQEGGQVTRAIRPEETIWLNFERIFTSNYKLVQDDPDYLKWLLQIKNESYPGLYDKSYVRRWTLPLTQYAQHYDYCDVCLAPLAADYMHQMPNRQIIRKPNVFNAVKSELKIIESGMKKKTLIAQDFGIYRELLKGTEMGILVDNNEKGWYKAIKSVINDKDYREMLANNLHEWVKKTYDINVVNETRIGFYRDLMAKKNNEPIVLESIQIGRAHV